MTALILVLGWTVAAVSVVQLPDNDAAGRAYFEKLHRNRATITSGYVEYTVTVNEDVSHPDNKGSVCTYRQWFEKDRLRMDIKESLPEDPANARNGRFAASDGVYRIIDMDKPNYCVREYTKENLNVEQPPVLPGIFIDPRLLGIMPIEYELLNHRRLDRLKNIQPGAEVHASRMQNSDATARVSIHYPDDSRETYVISEASVLPVKMTAQFAPKSLSDKGGSAV